jgi:hypothetical protein
MNGLDGQTERTEGGGARADAPGPGGPRPGGYPSGEYRPDGSHLFDPRRKSPALACILSLMPGLGQVYVGYYMRGFVHIAVVGTIIAVLAEEAIPPLTPLFGVFLAFFWLYNVVDAGRRAALLNQFVRGSDSGRLPGDIALPGEGGSMAGGGVLIVAGTLLLLHTRFGFSLSFLKDWWPAIPIALGAYLVWQGAKNRTGGGAS